jgi:cyclase
MLKKRIIYTLLYDAGYFMLSRNFRLQKVGDLEWLQRNYNFTQIAFFIDELIVLDITRGERDGKEFCEMLKALTSGCFVPIAAGGGIRSVNDARLLLRSGADKIVINTPLFNGTKLARGLVEEFGQQCVVGSVDVKRLPELGYRVVTDNGSKVINNNPNESMEWINEQLVGEIYLNSVERDGTGQGYDFGILDILPQHISIPVILAGGVGNVTHLKAGLQDPRVDAVATANLFNFIGDGLQRARESLIRQGSNLAVWFPINDINKIEVGLKHEM